MKLEIDVNPMRDALKMLNSDKILKAHLKQMAKEIAAYCKRELYKRTPKVTGELARGWMRSGGIRIRTTSKGCHIELVNPVEYAMAVNYGHWSHNQFNKGGTPYWVTPSHRTVKWWAGKSDARFVYGHFFVEKTANMLEFSNVMTDIIEDHLMEWFEECINGK